MPSITKVDLNQINKQIRTIDNLHQRLSAVESRLNYIANQTTQLDFAHARQTFNNLTFTWTGGTTTLSWTSGWLKSKNALLPLQLQIIQTGSYQNSGGVTPSVTQNIPIPAGSISGLTANTYYWLGWDTIGKQMYAFTDITQIYTKEHMQVVCQVFTGTAGQTGTAGGGGSQGGTDLSGARYKLF